MSLSTDREKLAVNSRPPLPKHRRRRRLDREVTKVAVLDMRSGGRGQREVKLTACLPVTRTRWNQRFPRTPSVPFMPDTADYGST